jgi:hypothetical protein
MRRMQRILILLGIAVVFAGGIVGYSRWRASRPSWVIPTERPNLDDIVGEYVLLSAPPQIPAPADARFFVQRTSNGKQSFDGKNLPQWWLWAPRGEKIAVWGHVQGRWELAGPLRGRWAINLDIWNTERPIESGGVFLTIAIAANGTRLLIDTVGDPDNNEFIVYGRRLPQAQAR